MDDEEFDEPKKTYPPSPAKMSKAPSWVMLGFLLGMAAVWGYRRSEEKPPAPAVTLTEWPRAVRVEPSPLTTIETWLRRAGFDPASASAPLVATLVDVTGVVLYFSIALLLLRGTLL